jgi:hypothetical protein
MIRTDDAPRVAVDRAGKGHSLIARPMPGMTAAACSIGELFSVRNRVDVGKDHWLHL